MNYIWEQLLYLHSLGTNLMMVYSIKL